MRGGEAVGLRVVLLMGFTVGCLGFTVSRPVSWRMLNSGPDSLLG